MTITAYQAIGGNVILPNNTSPALCVQLRLPNTGVYVVFGRLTVLNSTNSILIVDANLSTLDGATNLDAFPITVPSAAPNPSIACISLQSRLDVTAQNANEIVDIRCTAAGTPTGSNFASVTSSSLIAVSVDAFA